MLSTEPVPTAILLTVFGDLLAVSVAFSRASERVGVPVVLIFLIIGMLAGSEGIGGIVFTDYASAFRLGTVALVLILLRTARSWQRCSLAARSLVVLSGS